MSKYLIEHLEPEVYDWCLVEYKHISSFVGKENLIFTNVSDERLKELGRVDEQSVKDSPQEKACVLDPEAEKELTPERAKQFEVFIFGGILGDEPPRERTKEELQLSYPRFNLGKEQMSTDTAVIVTKMIVDGKRLEKIEFQQAAKIEIKEGEEVCLPYKYLVIDGKVLLAPGLVEMLKKQEGF